MNLGRIFAILLGFCLLQSIDVYGGKKGEDWEGEMNFRFYQAVVAYVNDPDGKAFEVNVDVREWNMLENGPREMLIKVYDPDGKVIVRKLVEDDGIVGEAFLPEAGGWDHEMWYYALCYSRGSQPMIRWSSFSEPDRVERLQKRHFSFQIKAGKPGIYRVLMCASRDHVATLSLKPALKYGVAGSPMWLHGHGDMFAKSYLYVPKGTIGMDIGFAEYDQPVTRKFKLTAPDGTVLWDRQAEGGLQSTYAPFEKGKYDDKILTLEVSKGKGDFMMHLMFRRDDVRLYRGKGGVPAIVCPDAETAKALKNGAIYYDGKVFWHQFQVRFHDWLKKLKPEDLVIKDVKGNPIKPTAGRKYGWGKTRMAYNGLPDVPGFVPLNGVHEAPPLSDTLMHKYVKLKQPAILNVAMQDLNEGLRMITVGETPVIGNFTGNLGYVFGTYGWHYWRPSWRLLQQTDAPKELKDIVQEAMIMCSDRLAFGRGIERVNGNAFSHIPIALRYAAEATQDPLTKKLATTYFQRFRDGGWGKGCGISKSGDCQEHFAHDYHYGTYIMANYKAILNDLNPPEFKAVIAKIYELYSYLYCRDDNAYPWGSRTSQQRGSFAYNWKANPGPSFTVSVNNGNEWFAARRPNYYALIFCGRLAPEWLNHYFGSKMGYGGGILCQVTVPGRGTVIASTLSGSYGKGMQRYKWRNFHIHSLVGTLTDGRPLIAADTEFLDAKLEGNTVTGSGEVRDRPIHVARSISFLDNKIVCQVKLRDTDLRVVYEGKGPSSTLTEAWEMIPYVVAKGRKAPGTKVITLKSKDGESHIVGSDLVLAPGFYIDRGGFGAKIVFDRPHRVKLGQNRTIMIELIDAPTQPDKIAFEYSITPYDGPLGGSAVKIKKTVLKKLAGITDLAGVQKALAGLKPYKIKAKNRELADIRLAVSGENLVVDATVNDPKISRHPTQVWKGSTFEIFASPPGKRSIGHIFLLPAIDKKPATALVAAKKGEKPAPEVKVRTAPQKEGYSVQTLIPLTSLGLAKDQKEMNLEFLVGVADTSKGKSMLYANLFKSIHAYENNTRYQPFQVEE